MSRAPCQRRRTGPGLRRRLAILLLVLYVTAMHGLPALHLAWHRNDHVHELGGLRWARQLPPHTHLRGERPESPHADLELSDCKQGPCQSLRAAAGGDSAVLAQHLAVGPAHALFAWLSVAQQVTLKLAASSQSVVLPVGAPAGRHLVARPRARAPPLSV